MKWNIVEILLLITNSWLEVVELREPCYIGWIVQELHDVYLHFVSLWGIIYGVQLSPWTRNFERVRYSNFKILCNAFGACNYLLVLRIYTRIFHCDKYLCIWHLLHILTFETIMVDIECISPWRCMFETGIIWKISEINYLTMIRSFEILLSLTICKDHVYSKLFCLNFVIQNRRISSK